MMTVIRTALVVATVAAITSSACAEDRSVLLTCKAMVERASRDANAASEVELDPVPPGDPRMGIARCANKCG
ncbi:hypothetical protein ACVWZZ_000701 [Bradyrhizobium sp. LM6.10]